MVEAFRWNEATVREALRDLQAAHDRGDTAYAGLDRVSMHQASLELQLILPLCAAGKFTGPIHPDAIELLSPLIATAHQRLRRKETGSGT
jgi:hypothetical protein